MPITAALEAALPLLACPHCAGTLRGEGDRVRCGAGHTFDAARQGYLSLLTGAGTRGLHADDADMVACRERVQGAGLFEPVTRALGVALAQARAGPGALVDLGGGTGYYAAACLDTLPPERTPLGIGVDLSRYAARRAAQAHPRLASVVADAWRALPLRDGVAGIALCVFAPRNPEELARVLAPAGVLAIVTPREGHLSGLGDDAAAVRIAPDKSQRLAAQLAGWHRVASRVVDEPLVVPGSSAADLLLMGPSAWHVDRAQQRERLTARESVTTRLAVDVTVVAPGAAMTGRDDRTP